jgi:hypothetical protein
MQKETIYYYYECDYNSYSETITDEILGNRMIYAKGLHKTDITWNTINNMLQDKWLIKSIKPLPMEDDGIVKTYKIIFYRE